MVALVHEAEAQVLVTPVPATPAWSGIDLLAHVVGVVDDALAGRLDGAGTDPWTAAQIESRRGRSVDELVDEWEAKAPTFEAFLDGIGASGRQAVFDVVTHEHDLRDALARPGARGSDGVHVGLTFVLPPFTAAAAEAGIRLRVEAGGGTWGPTGDVDAVLRAEPFEVLRATSGRRSADQVRALDWEGDPEVALPAFTFAFFRPRADALSE